MQPCKEDACGCGERAIVHRAAYASEQVARSCLQTAFEQDFTLSSNNAVKERVNAAADPRLPAPGGVVDAVTTTRRCCRRSSSAKVGELHLALPHRSFSASSYTEICFR